jgi:hypothetical protein
LRGKYLLGLIGIDLRFHPHNTAGRQTDVEPAVTPVGGIHQVAVFYEQIEFFSFFLFPSLDGRG